MEKLKEKKVVENYAFPVSSVFCHFLCGTSRYGATLVKLLIVKISGEVATLT
jgi:undecaprenyl pyrophosphate phosphatase UppP